MGYPNYDPVVQEKALYNLNQFDNDKYIKLFNIVLLNITSVLLQLFYSYYSFYY